MNTKYTAALLVVFLVLAGAAYYAGRGRAPVDLVKGTATATAAPLFELKASDIEEVVVDGPGPNVTLGRNAGGWDVNGQPSDDTVEAIVGRLAKPVPVRVLPADRDPKTYGFATASLTVTLKTADGKAHVLVFGDDTPVDSNIYVRMGADGPIYLLANGDANTLKGWLTKPPYRPTATPGPQDSGSPLPTDALAGPPTPEIPTLGAPPPGASAPAATPATPSPPRPPTPMPTEPKEPRPPATEPPTGPTAASTPVSTAQPTLGSPAP